MNRKYLNILFLTIFIACLLSTIYLNRVVETEATIASIGICNWLSNSSSFEKAPIGDKFRPKLEELRNLYGQNFECRVQRSNFNESYFETSVLVSASGSDVLGLRFGIYLKIYKRIGTIDYLGYWTPEIDS